MSRNRLTRLGYAVVAGLVLAGALAAPATAAAGGTVQGDFTTIDDGPIADAYVTAYTADDEWLAWAYTDGQGHYQFTDLPAGGIKLQFDINNLQQWSPGKRNSADATVYQLASGGSLTVDERQPATGTIAGHLTDNPPYFNVTATGVDQPAAVGGYAVDSGDWSIPVFPGTYKIGFNWDGSKQWAVGSVSEADGAVYTVAAGQTTTVDDTKLPTGTMSGRLTKVDGSPLADVWVSLFRGDEQTGWNVTDADGRYTFGEVIAGEGYTVAFDADGQERQWVPGVRSQQQATRFTVTAGEPTTVDDSQIAPATLHGRLVGEDGTAKSGFAVEILTDDQDHGLNYYGTTAADGTWSVGGIEPGGYRVSFRSPTAQRTQWAYGKDTEADATVIDVRSGGDVTVDDTWLSGGTLVVNAVDATTGAPVSNFCVWADLPTGMGADGCTTGSSVTVDDLAGGVYNLSATPDSDSYYLRSDSQSVTVATKQTTTATVRLVLGGKVSFTAKDHTSGAAVRRACGVFLVLGHGGLGDGYGNCTDATGKVTTETLATGTYEMFAVAPAGYGHQWVGAAGGTGDQKAAARIKVKAGRTIAAPGVLLDKPGKITGVVSDAAGAPLADVDVAYSAWGDAGPSWDTATDEHGVYTIDKLGPYGWPLLFGAGNYPREWSGHTGNRFQAETVPVVAGGSTTYNFTPRTTASLKGKVTSPVAGWRIHAFNAVTGDQMGTFDSSTAGPGGSYELPLAGDQKVKVDWSYYQEAGPSAQGWYQDAADIDSAKKVAIPAQGAKKLNLKLG
ncbi:carboxypeptidase-like regulatory domain-containing protein [Paractinoplanes toevensis]|uniref:alpha-amylase n=1 Tax=Paractinoplanes toevensis TaxID=571911 RepID=A0A919T8K1_9ACTN|nr:carboxypeptidase-like regulatory domain-containing protein [Actinoplanes toevensis]GIM91389.1 hypothetical protein Ato02nite_031820 [Actinoplanes toevensis]